MSSLTITTWTCDVCGDKVKIQGVYPPSGWARLTQVFVKRGASSTCEGQVCEKCIPKECQFYDYDCPHEHVGILGVLETFRGRFTRAVSAKPCEPVWPKVSGFFDQNFAILLFAMAGVVLGLMVFLGARR